MHHTATISDPMPIKPPPTSSSCHHHHLLSRKPKFGFFIITMASLFSFTLFLTLILFFTLSSATSRHHPPKSKPKPPSALSPPPPEIKQACKATRFPEACETTVSKAPNITQNPSPIQIIQSALWVSSDNRKTAQSMVKEILAAASGDPNHTTAAKNCLEVLHYSDYRVSSTADVLSSGKTRIKDARAWMSAALLYDYACWSSLKYVNDSQLVNRTMAFMDSLIGFTSNALSMMVSYDLFGDEIQSWKPPMTERSGSWEQNGGNSGSDLGFHEVVPSNLAADVTVCQDGGAGCVKTVQEAVNAAPDNLEKEKKFVIRIKAGVYKETVRVPLEKKNLVFLGEGMGKTVITGSLYAGQAGISTFNTATVGVNGDGFMARDMTFENTAGPDAHQAVAFRSDSDLSILENCEFLGNQDTLYADSLRQFYKSCRIEGNVDFIFGNSAAVFQDSQILVRPRQIKPEKGENNAITAHGRTDPAQSTGFVFENCMINGTEAYMKLYYSKPKVHRNYLGRPWKEYSRTVFLNCYLDALVASAGWMPWSGDFALSTLYYGEFENKGPGANTTDRVSWSSQIPKEHVLAYSVQSFIQGNDWIHSSS